MGLPKIRGTLLGVPIIRSTVHSIFGSMLGTPYLVRKTIICVFRDSTPIAANQVEKDMETGDLGSKTF